MQHWFKLFYDHVIAMDTLFFRHLIWSDGFTGYFKNECVFQWFYLLHIKYKVPHIWNYFETHHEKGEHGGVVGCIKTAFEEKR